MKSTLSSGMIPFSCGWLPVQRSTLLLATIAAVVLLLAWHLMPLCIWTYHVQRAGEQLERGMAWPAQRQVDSLPQVTDAEALNRARMHLREAIRWRPRDEHAYRLAGNLYGAYGDWLRAAELLERARTLAPSHPTIALESYLVQERLLEVVEAAPQRPLVGRFARGRLEAPEGGLDTDYCRPERPESCYIAATTFSSPYAGLVRGEKQELPTLFLHSPARVHYSLQLPAGQPALFFLHALDPRARDRGSDGATFQLWVKSQADESSLIYEKTLNGGLASEGWIPGWADLSPWAGEKVTITLVTGPGPNGDTTADWYGWGQLALTTVGGARYAARLPGPRMVDLLLPNVLEAATFARRAEQAAAAGRTEEAERWHRRAEEADRLDGG